jgi:hypothetical protein
LDTGNEHLILSSGAHGLVRPLAYWLNGAEAVMSSTIPFPWDANAWMVDIVTTLGLQQRLATPPSTGRLLWHYTTINGFKNIIKGKVHLNPLDRMNDCERVSGYLLIYLRFKTGKAALDATFCHTNHLERSPSRFPRNATFSVNGDTRTAAEASQSDLIRHCCATPESRFPTGKSWQAHLG